DFPCTLGRCIENYTGARCEEVFLPSSSIPSESNLSAAFVVLAVLLTLTIAALCFLCRARVELTLQDICEMLKGRLKKWKGHLQRASSVQCEISLVETNNTRTRHSHREH
ncbi:neuregulin 4, isoform CRA_a, partial [Mus musculus]